jgi:hypothetical protein
MLGFPADVVTHDEEDVRFLLLLRGGGCARHRRRGKQPQQTEAERSGHTHTSFPPCQLPKDGADSLRPNAIARRLRRRENAW